MQANQQPIKLHWFPARPTWIVSIVLVILAALPHQLPLPVAFGLRTVIGATLFAVVAAAVYWKEPILGIAMFILLSSTYTSSYIEGFGQNIIKDSVNRTKSRWMSEVVMGESPDIIQERSDSILTTDVVTDQDAKPWFGEDALGEHPTSFQERSEPSQTLQETSESPQTR
jgi:hypothetical protein